MPPLLPRPALMPRTAASIITSALSRAAICLFSSSAGRAARPRIPPESPLFINVPNPPQDQSVEALRERKPVKGFIPVPRPVFRRRDGHLKPRDKWLSRSAPEPAAGRGADAARSDVQAWKRRLAASRRANMREGVRTLYARKQRADRVRQARRAAALAANRAAAVAPEREDDRLTRASVNAETLRVAVRPDPDRLGRALESRRRTDLLAAQRSEVRRDAIQELYMKARSFIVSERDLEAEVERQFAPDYWKDMGSSAIGYEIQNVWDQSGRPRTVADMLMDVTRNSTSVIKNVESEKTRTLKRQKEVTEELTGGKLE